MMARMIKKKYPDIKIELTAKGMPQQNGKLERAIATVWSRVRAMMTGAGMGNRMSEKCGLKLGKPLWRGGMHLLR